MQKSHTKRRNVKSAVKYVTETEFQQMLKAAREGRYPERDQLILRLLFEHGLRVSELAQAKRSQVKLKDGRLWVSRLKGSRSTEHPLSGAALRALRAHLRERTDGLSWLIINERGDQFTRQGLYYLVRAIGARGGLEVHPHMLRHGCGFALANRGRDTRLIQDYLGHQDIRNTVTYTATAASRFEGLWD